jgi:hypothetical protein
MGLSEMDIWSNQTTLEFEWGLAVKGALMGSAVNTPVRMRGL